MQAFEARLLDRAIEAEAVMAGLDAGASVVFLGRVRDEGGRLSALTLEHYPGMTERALYGIIESAQTRWPDLCAARILHRTGRMTPGEIIVAAAAASPRRATAFAAAGFIMDYLKTRAPFWKQEEWTDGARSWVEAKADDGEAAARWD